MKVLEEDLLYVAEKIQNLDFGDSTFFITGATGLVGSVLVKTLLKYNNVYGHHCKVIAMVRSIEKAEKIFGKESDIEGLMYCVGDVTNVISCAEHIDYIVHAASETKSLNMVQKPVETLWTSVCGTKNVLDFAVEKNVKGIIYLSSMEAFGKVNSQDERVKEDQLGYIALENVRNCYPESKRLCENMCVCYAGEYHLPVTTARLAQTFGAGVPETDQRVFSQFARSVINGQDIVLHTKGNSYGNYVYTADAAAAVFLLLKKGARGEVYTVANETTTMRIREMAHLVAGEIAEGKINVVFDIPEGNQYGYASETALKLDASKLRELGWSPKYDLKDFYNRLILSWNEDNQLLS